MSDITSFLAVSTVLNVFILFSFVCVLLTVICNLDYTGGTSYDRVRDS